MKVPTYEASRGIQTGSTGPQANPDDFGLSTAQAIGQTGNALGSVAAGLSDVAAAQRERKYIDDVSWVGESMAQEKNFVSKWMADPENNSKESFADDLQGLLKERLTTYSSATRSQRATQMFRNQFQSFASSQYEQALSVAGRTRMENLTIGASRQIDNVLEAYRNTRDIPGSNPGGEIITNLQAVGDNIEATFGRIAPNVARKLKEKLIIDATYATMQDDPKLAKRILNASTTIDESQRKSLLDQIDEAARSKDALEIEAFTKIRADTIAQAELGKSRGKIGLEIYQSYYPRDKAVVLKSRDDAAIDMFNKSNSLYSRINSWSAPRQEMEISKLLNSANSAEDKDVLEFLSRKVKANVELQEKNRVSWLQQFNPTVKNALTRAQSSTDQQRIQALGELYDVVLKYQGQAPADAPETEQPLYLNLPLGDRHLMTVEESEQNADYINKGSPKQKLQLIQEVLARYPDERHQNIAFNDLVTLPRGQRGIKQEYQLAFLNAKAHWVDSYLGAIENTESIKNVAPEKRAEYEKELTGNPLWLAFSHSVLGDNFQRGDEVEGFKNGILTYAYARAAQNGESPAKAVKAAAQLLISEELGFASVNGKTLMIARDRGPGKPARSDQVIQTLGERLRLSLQFIDPRQVKLSDDYQRKLFPALDLAGSEMVKMQALRDAITAHGTFQASPDGQSVSLYYDDGNNRFEVRDQNNRAFTINLDELQETTVFNSRVINPMTGFSMPTVPGVKGVGSGQHNASYDLIERAPNWSFFNRQYTTNWPMDMPFIKRGGQTAPHTSKTAPPRAPLTPDLPVSDESRLNDER